MPLSSHALQFMIILLQKEHTFTARYRLPGRSKRSLKLSGSDISFAKAVSYGNFAKERDDYDTIIDAKSDGRLVD